MNTEPLVQTSTGTRERLAREIVAVSRPYRSGKSEVRHQRYLLTLRVDVLQERLDLLLTQAGMNHEGTEARR